MRLTDRCIDFRLLRLSFHLRFAFVMAVTKSSEAMSSIVGVNQIPLWVHLNFSPLHETSSQGPKPNHAHIARKVWLWSLTTSPVKRVKKFRFTKVVFD